MQSLNDINFTINSFNTKPDYEFPWKPLAYTISALACVALALVPAAAKARLIPITVKASSPLFIPAAIGCMGFIKKAIDSYKASRSKAQYDFAKNCRNRKTAKRWFAEAALNKHPLALFELANRTKDINAKIRMLGDASALGNQKAVEMQKILYFQISTDMLLNHLCILEQSLNNEEKARLAAGIVEQRLQIEVNSYGSSNLRRLKKIINEIFESRDDFDFNTVLNLVESQSKKFPHTHALFF